MFGGQFRRLEIHSPVMHIPAGQFKPWEASPVAGQALCALLRLPLGFQDHLEQVEFYQYRRF
jgi:hypothetical protein